MDFDSKQACFQVKPDHTCDVDEVKRAIAAAGNYEVTKVKMPVK